jgi:hypothetical protein
MNTPELPTPHYTPAAKQLRLALIEQFKAALHFLALREMVDGHTLDTDCLKDAELAITQGVRLNDIVTRNRRIGDDS